jgi:hypothetical protein
MPNVPDLGVKKQLKVGIAVPPAANLIGISGGGIRGSAFIEGPIDVGTPVFVPGESNVCISRCINPDAIPLPLSLVKIRNAPLVPALPTDVIIGDLAGPVGVTVFCGPSFFTVQATAITLLEAAYTNTSIVKDDIAALYTDISNKVFALFKSEIGINKNIALDLKDSPVIGAAPMYAPDFITLGAASLNTAFDMAAAALAKNFDINHPTKKGHRLRHSCVETPQNDVYYRGRMENTTTINLPDYWRGLVDPDSIGVNLTPMGSYQELYVEKIEWGTKVIVKNASGGPIKCSYVVFAERKDVEKLIPEYEGETPESYPGNNDVYDISGWNK